MGEFSTPPPGLAVLPVHHRNVTPTPLVPLEPPPSVSAEDLPPFPFPPRPSLSDSYARSTHFVPAAFPRSTPDVPPTPPPRWSANKEEYRKSVQRTTEEVIAKRMEFLRGDLRAGGSRQPLYSCVTRFVRKDVDAPAGNKTGLTLFVSHATGFGKEIWEPAIHELIESYKSAATTTIDEIWLWEAVNHGESGLVNAPSLGGLYDWKDNARDMLNFLQSYLPSSVSTPTLPNLLPRLPESVKESRLSHGFTDRTVVGIGHSFGGCTMMLTALNAPKLFSSLVMVDAMILPRRGEYDEFPNSALPRTRSAVQRRDHWSSREEARQLLKEAPFFKTWHPAMFDIYVAHGLCEDPCGGVCLTTSRMQEAAAYADAQTQWDAWELLPTLDERVGVLWVTPGLLTPEELAVRKVLVTRRPRNSMHVFMPSAGHLIPHEKPGELAQEIRKFLERRHGSQDARL